jgi:hypothetical protein
MTSVDRDRIAETLGQIQLADAAEGSPDSSHGRSNG